MKAHLILSIGLTLLTAPAYAAEKWECLFTDLSPTTSRGLEGLGKIEIEGEMLNWMVQVPKNPSRPQDGPTWGTFPYKLLQNNSLGAISVDSAARMLDDGQPLVTAVVTVLVKTNGDFRQGVVTPEGARDVMAGRCKLIAPK